MAARNRADRGRVIEFVTRVLLEDVGIRFLKREGKNWVELDEKAARGKVGHALRDMMVAQQHAKAGPTTNAAKKQRQSRRCSEVDRVHRESRARDSHQPTSDQHYDQLSTENVLGNELDDLIREDNLLYHDS